MTTKRVSVLLFMASLVGPAGAEPEPAWEFSAAYSHSQGDYGTPVQTSVNYIPLIWTRFHQRGELSLTVPYVNVTGDRSVTIVSGGPKRTVRQSTGVVRTSEGGLGDIILGGRLYGLLERSNFPAVDLTGFIKFPTASESDGLGTGEFDEGVGLRFTKSFAPVHYGFLEMGYTFVGGFRNQWNALIGYGRSLTDNWFVSTAYEERRALIEGEDNPRDLYFSARHRFTERAFGDASLGFGLSDGSPDTLFSFGGGFRY